MGGLRRKAWYGLAVVGFAAGALAGVALGGGLPADLITTALPTVSTPTISTPTVSTPTVTTPTVTTPTVSTPTVSTPTVTAPVSTTVRTPPVTTVAATVPSPVRTTATLPAVTVAGGDEGDKTCGLGAGRGGGTATARRSACERARAAVVTRRGCGRSSCRAAVGSRSRSRTRRSQDSRQRRLSVLRASLTSLRAVPRDGRPSALPRRRRPPDGARLAARTGADDARARTLSPCRRLSRSRQRACCTGFVRRSAPVAGVLAALTALAAVGLAGAARSTNGLAACLDLARLPFPRFRILPCPGDATPGASELGAIAGAAPPPAERPRAGIGHRGEPDACRAFTSRVSAVCSAAPWRATSRGSS